MKTCGNNHNGQNPRNNWLTRKIFFRNLKIAEKRKEKKSVFSTVPLNLMILYFPGVFIKSFKKREKILHNLSYLSTRERFVHLVRTQNFSKNYFLHPDTNTNVCVSGG